MSCLFKVVVIVIAGSIITMCQMKLNQMADEDYKACIEAGEMSDETCFHYAYY